MFRYPSVIKILRIDPVFSIGLVLFKKHEPIISLEVKRVLRVYINR